MALMVISNLRLKSFHRIHLLTGQFLWKYWFKERLTCIAIMMSFLYRNNDVFYIEKDKLYVLEMETVQDQQSVRYKKKYVGILNLLFSDCQGLPKDAANV